jgi:hypothetical protein
LLLAISQGLASVVITVAPLRAIVDHFAPVLDVGVLRLVLESSRDDDLTFRGLVGKPSKEARVTAVAHLTFQNRS